MVHSMVSFRVAGRFARFDRFGWHCFFMVLLFRGRVDGIGLSQGDAQVMRLAQPSRGRGKPPVGRCAPPGGAIAVEGRVDTVSQGFDLGTDAGELDAVHEGAGFVEHGAPLAGPLVKLASGPAYSGCLTEVVAGLEATAEKIKAMEPLTEVPVVLKAPQQPAYGRVW